MADSDPLREDSAQDQPVDGSDIPTQPATPKDRLAIPGTIRIPCPHCGRAIQVVGDSETEVTCASCGSSFQVDSAFAALGRESKPPQSVGRFTVLERLGRGGFGVVYKAADPLLGRHVAVKLPRAGYFSSTEDEERFFREARNAARLQHPHIVRIHEVDRHHGVPYIVSEYIAGRTLADLLSERRLGFREAATLIAEVAEALEYAHQQHVVHRDIKPSNILLDESLRPYVTDFGLARRDDLEITITVEGQVLGTPAYMSPEQAAGEQQRVDRRSDVYSLGVVLYHAISGSLPFRGSRRMLVRQVIHDEPVAPRRINDEVPRDLETITLKAMAKEPSHRYATAQEFADDLRRWIRGEPIHARPSGRIERAWRWCRRNPVIASLWAAIAVLLLTIVAATSLWAWRERSLRAMADTARHEAEQSDKVSRDRLVLIHLRNAVQEGSAHDDLKSLVWSCEAMRVDQPDDPLTTQHRLQIGTLLDRLPALAGIWTSPGSIACTEFNAAGDRLLIAGADGKVTLYDPRTGQLAVPAMHHGFAITRATFDPTGKRLLAAGLDNSVYLWNAETGQQQARLEHSGRPVHAVFSPDGTRVATASLDGKATVWNADTGTVVQELPHTDEQVTLVQYSPDGSLLLTAAKGGVESPGHLRLWRPETAEQVAKTMQHDDYVWHAAFSSDGHRIASASEDRTVRLWDVTTCEPTTEPLRHATPVMRVFWTQDDQQVLTTESGGQVRVWNAQTGGLQQAAIHHGGFLAATSLSPSGRILVTGGGDGRTRCWSWVSSLEITPVLLQQGTISAIAIDQQDRHVAIASHDGTVRLWDLAASVPHVVELNHDEEVLTSRFSADGRRILTTSHDKTARQWNTENGQPIGTPLQHDASVYCGVFSPDGKLIATGSDNYVQLWEASTGQAIGARCDHEGVIVRLAFHPTEPWLLSASQQGLVKLWDAGSRTVRFVVNHEARLTVAGFSRDGRWIYTAGDDGTLRLWRAADGQSDGNHLKHDDKILSCVFSPDSRYALTGGQDHTARLWEIASREPSAPPLIHPGSVLACDFRADSQAFATGDLQGNIRVWRPGEYDRPWRSFTDQDRMVQALRFTSSGDVLASALNRHPANQQLRWGDGFIILWDLRTGLPLGDPFPHRGAVTQLAISPTGTQLLSGGTERCARLWSLQSTAIPTADLQRLARLLSGLQMDANFQLIPVDRAMLQEDFAALRQLTPSALTSTPGDVATWQTWLSAEASHAPAAVPSE
jgi:WD40 repeat protein